MGVVLAQVVEPALVHDEDAAGDDGGPADADRRPDSREDALRSHMGGTDLMGRVGSLLAIFCSIGICSHLKWRLQSNPVKEKAISG